MTPDGRSSPCTRGEAPARGSRPHRVSARNAGTPELVLWREHFSGVRGPSASTRLCGAGALPLTKHPQNTSGSERWPVGELVLGPKQRARIRAVADGAGQWLTEGEFWAKHERRFLAGLGGDLVPGHRPGGYDDQVREPLSHRARYRHPFFRWRKVGSIDNASVELWLSDRSKAGHGRSPAKRTRVNAETRLGLTHTGHA